MWAYLAGYEIPNDDPEALERRVRVAYPVKIDRAIGFGTTPTVRLQRAFATPGRFNAVEKVLVWCHWVWFMVPHGTVAYLLLRHPERFERGAVRMYATFDLGLVAYWKLPTAPPWYAADRGLMEDGKTPELRRMMVEYGEEFWKSGWAPLYGFLAGNPLAAMPSLHFATSVMAARLLGETGGCPARWAGRTPRRSGSRSCTSASTTSSTWPPATRSRRCAPRRPRLDPVAGAPLARRAGAGGAGSMTTEAARDRPSRRITTRASSFDITPRKLGDLRGLRGADGRRAVLPAAAARRPRQDLAPHPGRRPVWLTSPAS